MEIYEGGSYFGSGGAYVNAYWAGEEPQVDSARKGGYTDNGFTSESGMWYVLTSPSVIYTVSGDAIGRNGRVFGRTAYVCATEAQIEAAKLAEPFVPTGWYLETHDFYGYNSWSLQPRFWGEPGDAGLRLARNTHGNGESVTLLYFPEDGSHPIALGSFGCYNECYCDARWDESGEILCICKGEEVPSTVEGAVRLLKVSRHLQEALNAYLQGGKGMMQAIKAAAREV